MACRKRHFLLVICVVQMIIVIWRQVFDYLGFMWGPILVNFFQIIFVIFGFFGAWQFRSKYMLCYTIWSMFWCGWNIFVICFYENIGILNREWDLLNLGTGSVSWWEANGPGCKALFLANQTGIETYPWRPLRPDVVSGCILPYYHLEAAQASVHLILAVLGASLGILMLGSIRKKEENSSAVNKTKKSNSSLYAVDYTPQRSNIDSVTESVEDDGDGSRNGGGGSRPMTPRRVKRRSVHSRGSSLPPPYQPSIRRHNGSRSSTRSSGRRRSHQNPVTKLLDHQAAAIHQEMGGHTNMMYQQSSVHSLYDEERPSSARSSYSNYHGTRSHSYRHSHNFLATGPPAYSSQSEIFILLTVLFISSLYAVVFSFL